VDGSLLLYGGCGFDENESGCVVAEAHLCRSVQTEIFSVAWDRDGATLFMDPSGVDMFKRAVRLASSLCSLVGGWLHWLTHGIVRWCLFVWQGVDATITIAPQQWRAIQVSAAAKLDIRFHSLASSGKWMLISRAPLEMMA
jgi:hypothetical protein